MIANVPPAKWGDLIDLYVLIKNADLAKAPIPSGDDDKAHDLMLEKIIKGESLEAATATEDEL